MPNGGRSPTTAPSAKQPADSSAGTRRGDPAPELAFGPGPDSAAPSAGFPLAAGLCHIRLRCRPLPPTWLGDVHQLPPALVLAVRSAVTPAIRLTLPFFHGSQQEHRRAQFVPSLSMVRGRVANIGPFQHGGEHFALFTSTVLRSKVVLAGGPA